MIRHWTRHLATERDPAVAAADGPLAGDQHDRPVLHRRRARDRAGHEVPRRRLDHDPRDAVLLHDHARHQGPLRQRASWSCRPTRRTTSSRPGCTRSCSSPSCTSRPCARWRSPRPPGPTCSRASTSPPTRRDQPAAGGVGRAQPRGAAEGAALAVPRAGPADRRVRHGDPAGQPARCGGGLHPRVRRRALVGAAAAQPDGAAAQGPVAVHPRGHGHLGALPAAVLADRP